MKIGTHTSFLEPRKAIGHSSAGDPICVLCIPFDGKNVHTAFDYSCYGNNGIIIGATYRKEGEDWSLNFDGDDFVEVLNSASLNFDVRSFSIESRISTLSAVEFDLIVSKRGTNAPWNGYDLSIWELPGRIQGFIRDAAGIDASGIGTTFINDGRMHHAGMIVDRSLQRIRAFVNGMFEGTIGDTTLVGNVDIVHNLIIGATAETRMHFWKGFINEVRIYSRAKSATEI